MEKNYLQTIMEKNLNVTVFLTCNVKLQGQIKSFDEVSILLEHDNRLQLIYKHAISTITAGTLLKGDEFVG
ncbi:MAG: RNA chaperone Hfq [Alphaproteobacteria bacterium]|nr:RNA chaperone Hfq [Alphaproteobacteria bacterium]